MIQNILTFCVKNDLTFVEGSIPSGKLVANDINRNSIYLVTPYDEAIVKANFQTNLQSDTPTSVLGILVNGKITIDEIVPTSKSYYNLVKDWNIYEFKVPSTTLSFISRNRTGKIGINFSIEQRLVPAIKDSYGEYQGEILSLEQALNESGYYINKTIGFQLDTGVDVITYDLNDILVLTKQESPLDDIQVKISAYSNRGSTPTAMYSVDPSLLNDNFETIEPSLTMQIVQQVNDNTGDIVLLFQNVGINNDTLVDLENRMSVAEQDIDTAEGNITNLQGRMATAESDIDNIENGTTIVEKALRDSLGNIIKDHYIASVIPTYDDNTNNFYINPYNGNDSLMPTRIEGVTLPKATTSKDGLMAKEDKVKVDNIASDISSAITTHDNSAVAHLPLRTLINNLQQEIDRLNAKGRSWGEVDKTFSELWAMAEPTRSDYINTFLATAFSGYTPSNGDLVYTIVSDTVEEHELEYNSTLSQWIDNGAYIVSKASNTQHGIVKGDLTYVSILNGIIQVLKSDYATNVGSSGASYDYDDLLALFTEVANDIYKKNETYSNMEIEQRITDLLGLANLQDVLIGSYTNGQTVLASDLSPYNFVIALGKDVNDTYTVTFKPSEIVNGNVISLSSTVYLTRGATNYTITAPTSIKLWGIKLDGITANEVDYDNSTSGLVADKVQGAIDEVAVELNTLENRVDITNTKQDIRINEIEELARKSASGETSDNVLGTDIIPLSKDTANAHMSVEVDGGILEAPNLVVNGDFSDGTTEWSAQGSILSNVSNNLLVTGNGTSDLTRVYQTQTLGVSTYYIKTRVRVTNALATTLASSYYIPGTIVLNLVSNPVENQWYELSHVFTNSETITRFPQIYASYANTTDANGSTMEIDYAYAFNVSEMKLKGVKDDNGVLFSDLTDLEIKEQLDLWISKGILPNDNLLSVNMNKRVRSVGKNLFDINEFENGYISISGNEVDSTTIFRMKNYLKINKDLDYTVSIQSGTGINISYFDKDMNFISYEGNSAWTEKTLVIPSSAVYLRCYILEPLTTINYVLPMLEYGTTATTYQPYHSSDLYLQANTKGYSLPNGVKDTIEYRNGKYYFVNRVHEVTLTSGMITSLNTSSYTNIDVVSIQIGAMFTNWIYNGVSVASRIQSTTLYSGFVDNFESPPTYDNVANVNRNLVQFTSGNILSLAVAKGTYASLAEAQTALVGTKIWYQLATPIETEIEAWGNLQGYESGIVYVDDIKIDASIYASGITTTSEIKTLDEIVKITNGVETQLDTSLAVIAVDKLSFTHPDLVDGDYVWFAYEEDGNYYKATTDITYYIDKLVRTSPDGSVWKLDWSVDNSGVITWTPTKI